MKKRIQKYLSGEKEGFSLVELIIVIAIMAILIGIVALAVIPYLEQSRVGKDQQTVDTVYSAFQTTLATEQVTESVTLTITSSGATLDKASSYSDFVVHMAEKMSAKDAASLAAGSVGKLESADAKGKNIVCTYTKDTGEIKVTCGDADIVSSNKGTSSSGSGNNNQSGGDDTQG